MTLISDAVCVSALKLLLLLQILLSKTQNPHLVRCSRPFFVSHQQPSVTFSPPPLPSRYATQRVLFDCIVYKSFKQQAVFPLIWETVCHFQWQKVSTSMKKTYLYFSILQKMGIVELFIYGHPQPGNSSLPE